MSDIEISQEMAADAAKIYDLVSDLPRMGQWSPENTGGRWLAGATGPAVGAKFKGTNKHKFLRWSTTVTVTDAVPGKRFAFNVDYLGVPISTWSYDFEPDGAGCKVVESWTDRRPTWMKLASAPVMQVADRGAHNRRTMQATLAALRAAAEK